MKLNLVLIIILLISSCKRGSFKEYRAKVLSEDVVTKIKRGEIISDDLISIDINDRDGNGRTMLMLATLNNNKAMVDKLLHFGANLLIEDNSGKTVFELVNSDISIALSRAQEMRSISYSGFSLEAKLIYDSIMSSQIHKYLDKIPIVKDEKNLNGDTLLSIAVKQNSLEAVKALIEHSNINSINYEGYSILHSAIKGRSSHILKLLLDGADIDQRDFEGNTPLMLAVIEGNSVFVQMLSELSDINAKNNCGQSALMLAAREGNKYLMDILPEDDITFVDNRGRDLLYYAIEGGNVKVLEYFLDKIQVVSEEYKMELIDVALEEKSREIMDYLMWKYDNEESSQKVRKRFLDIRKKMAISEEKNAIIFAIEESSLEMLLEELSKEEAGEEINLRNDSDKMNTPLIYAVKAGNVKIVRELVKRGARVDDVNIDGKSALILAIESRNIEVVRYLLTRSVKIMEKEALYKTTLSLIKEKRLERELYLEIKYLEYKKRELEGSEGKTALMYAIEGREKIGVIKKIVSTMNLEELMKKDSYGHEIYWYENNKAIPSVANYLKEIRNLIDQTEGRTHLMLFSYIGNRKMVEILLPISNVEDQNDSNKTALMYAAEGGNREIVEMLLPLSNVEVAVTDNYNRGKTALMFAVEGGNREIVELLLPLSDVRVDSYGKTLLMSAAEVGSKEIVELLLPISNVKDQDYYGKTALMYARVQGNKEIVELLKK